MKYVFCIILLVLSYSNLISKDRSELMQELEGSEGVKRASILNKIAKTWKYDCKKVMYYAEQAAEIAKEYSDTAQCLKAKLQIIGCLCNQNYLDSASTIINVCQKQTKDHPKYKIELLICQLEILLATNDSEKALENVRLIDDLIEPLSNKRQVKVLIRLADMLEDTGDLINSKHYATKALKIAKDSSSIANANYYLGKLYKRLLQYDVSLKYYYKALRMYELLGKEKGMIKVHHRIGTNYRLQGQLDKAQTYYEEELKEGIRIKDNYIKGRAYHGLGNISFARKNFEEAKRYFKQSLSLKEESSEPEQLLNSMEKLGIVYSELNQFQNALDELCKTSELGMLYGEWDNYIRANIAIGTVYFKQKDFGNAQQQLLQVLEELETTKYIAEKAEAYLQLSKVESAMGTYNVAYEYHKKYDILKDSINNATNAHIINEMQARFEVERKKERIKSLEKENDYNSEIIRQNTVVNWTVAFVFVLIIVIGIGYIKNNNQRKKTNQQLAQKNIEVEILLKEIHHRVKNNLQIISSMFRLQSRHIKDKTAKEAIKTGQGRIKSMALIHQRLYQNNELKLIPMQVFIRDLTENLIFSYHIDEKQITLRQEIEDINLDVDTATPLGLIINELVTNALKYAFPVGHPNSELLVRLKKTSSGVYELIVSDNGVGMPRLPDEELFDNSFGMELVHSLTEKLKGTITFKNKNGTWVQLYIPAI